jgi:hypothetical protein
VQGIDPDMRIRRIHVLLLLLLALVPPVLAHTPLEMEGENHSLETAMEIPNPTKSWTLYEEIHEAGEAEYFELHMEPGERLRISLYLPRNEDPGFSPNLVIMGPGIASMDEAPGFVEVPEGAGVALVKSEHPERPEYEPFTPTSYYYIADYDTEVTVGGHYYFAVYESDGEGRYGLAIGYEEEFTLIEWIKIPLDVIGIRLWEGQPLLLFFAPVLLALMAGYGLLFWRSHIGLSAFNLASATTGLLYVGSGMVILMEMAMSLYGAAYDSLAFLTVVFVLLPVLLGYAVLRKVHRGQAAISTRDRVVLVALGVLGLFVWAGFLVGPVLAVLAGILPSGG